MLGALGLWLGAPLVSVAPNRIVPGEGVYATELLGTVLALSALLPLALVAGAGRLPTLSGLRGALALVIALLAGLPLLLAWAAQRLVTPELPGARLGIGPAWWGLLFLFLLALVELRTRLAIARLSLWGLLLPVVLVWWLALDGWLAPLALVQEFSGRRQQFATALVQHLALVGAAVGISLLIAVLLALAMRHNPTLRRTGFGVLNFLQTIPSLALFGLLLAPLAWLADRYPWLAELGVQGIGWAPALLALVGYSLLPLVRNCYVALEAVAPGVLEAGRGMGMSRRQLFWQVRLPLALPVILEGVRITTVQAIGLTAVAALIGAGGLGRFIFQGLGQAAMDLVLLGALPILGLALLVDGLLGALSRQLQQGADA
nr:ABC transporter permease [Motiliproteus sp. SC1-56]